MPRYIDTEALYGSLNASLDTGYESFSPNLICEMIDNAPTADVEPVRHGRWIDIGNSDETEGMWGCTECGYQTYHGFALIDEIQECGSMIYCEHCGAKMNRESEVEDDDGE